MENLLLSEINVIGSLPFIMGENWNRVKNVGSPRMDGRLGRCEREFIETYSKAKAEFHHRRKIYRPSKDTCYEGV